VSYGRLKHSHAGPLLPELVRARDGHAKPGEHGTIENVKQLLITGSQSIFCSPFEKYHEMVRIFLKIGTAFG
jgi:hypothetical protein